MPIPDAAARFYERLDAALSDPELEAALYAEHSQTVVTLVCDMTALTRRTEEAGIVRALALARRALARVELAAHAQGGQLVKHVADTVFMTLPDPPAALNAALEAVILVRQMEKERLGATVHGHDPRVIHPCIGLGFGEALVIPGFDLFGSETNKAFVLGEDVAKGDEILCTPAFLRALGPLPEGVGCFQAPSDRVQESGFPFFVLRDYR